MKTSDLISGTLEIILQTDFSLHDLINLQYHQIVLLSYLALVIKADRLEESKALLVEMIDKLITDHPLVSDSLKFVTEALLENDPELNVHSADVIDLVPILEKLKKRGL